MKPVVVKIGGSVLESGRLKSVLDAIVEVERPIVIVSGGGSFADAVRKTQKRLKFSDATAHRMAILAMHQTAEILLGSHRKFAPVETLRDIRRVIGERRIGVWLPARMAYVDTTIAADWSVTSDALAARLAERMGGADVVLVKSCTIPRAASAAVLADRGIVDPVFPDIVERAGLTWGAVASRNIVRLTQLLGVPIGDKPIRRIGQSMLSRETNKRS